MAVSIRAAQYARSRGIPVVFDGGSWKPRTEELLPYVDYALCSEQFFPPGCANGTDVFDYLSFYKIPYRAITRGERSLLYQHNGSEDEIRLVSSLPVVDTLGAGDFFHGAFLFYLLNRRGDFPTFLEKATQIAAFSCSYFGTREWLKHYNSTMNA